jgi:hypothetical protein
MNLLFIYLLDTLKTTYGIPPTLIKTAEKSTFHIFIEPWYNINDGIPVFTQTDLYENVIGVISPFIKYIK